MATATWRRLDTPGHDTVHVVRIGDEWELRGRADWSEPTGAWSLEYVVTCDAHWRTRAAAVRGAVDGASVTHMITRSETGVWTLDGVPVASVTGCDDIDLSFTPATNLLPIRRLALGVGASAPVRAAWLGIPDLDLQPLEQAYRHAAPDVYMYESEGGFRRELTVDATGLVLDYPGMWTAERAVAQRLLARQSSTDTESRRRR